MLGELKRESFSSRQILNHLWYQAHSLTATSLDNLSQKHQVKLLSASWPMEMLR